MSRNTTWTDEEDAYLLANCERMTSEAIGAHLGRTRSQVNHRLRRLEVMGVEIPDRYGLGNNAPVEPQRIIDGYDDVPWQCRIDGRPQGMSITL